MPKRSPYSTTIPVKSAREQITMFFQKLPDFKEETINGRLFISKSFPKKLKIEIATPYLPAEKQNSEARLMSGMPIEITLKRLKETCLKMTTHIILGWESFTARRVKLFIEAIEKAPKCPKCKGDTFPTKNKEGSLSFECVNCEKITEPEYGSGFSLLKSYLKKN